VGDRPRLELYPVFKFSRFLNFLGLARIKKIAPKLLVDQQKPEIDLDTVRAVITNRLHIMSRYARVVVTRVYREEKSKANIATRKLLKRGKQLIIRPATRMDAKARIMLEELLRQNRAMQIVYDFGQRLQAIWTEKTATQESLLNSLREWCEEAEATGIEALQEFARSLRTYTLQPA